MIKAATDTKQTLKNSESGNSGIMSVTEISLDTTEAGRPFYESLVFVRSNECMVLVRA